MHIVIQIEEDVVLQVIQIEEDVVLQDVLLLVTVFFSDHHLSLGNRRNKQMSHIRW